MTSRGVEQGRTEERRFDVMKKRTPAFLLSAGESADASCGIWRRERWPRRRL